MAFNKKKCTRSVKETTVKFIDDNNVAIVENLDVVNKGKDVKFNCSIHTKVRKFCIDESQIEKLNIFNSVTFVGIFMLTFMIHIQICHTERCRSTVMKLTRLDQF